MAVGRILAIQGGGVEITVPLLDPPGVIVGKAADWDEIGVDGLAYQVVAQRRRRGAHIFCRGKMCSVRTVYPNTKQTLRGAGGPTMAPAGVIRLLFSRSALRLGRPLSAGSARRPDRTQSILLRGLLVGYALFYQFSSVFPPAATSFISKAGLKLCIFYRRMRFRRMATRMVCACFNRS